MAEAESEPPSVSAVLDRRAEPPLARELRAELWSEENPFAFADPQFVDRGGSSPNLTPDLIDALLSETAPDFWLELGTGLGGTAIAIAERITVAGLETTICTVDSFTGGVTAWLKEKLARERDEWRYLRLTNGRPTLYERFLANIQQSGDEGLIVPLPSTPLVAMRLIGTLVEEGRLIQPPEVISFHPEAAAEELLPELHRAWLLLQPGGVLLGDDWATTGVRHDVRAFARTVEADTTRMVAFLRRFEESYLDGNVFLYRGQWVLFKPMTGSSVVGRQS